MIKNHNLSFYNLFAKLFKFLFFTSINLVNHKIAQNFLIFLILDLLMVSLLLLGGFINLNLLYGWLKKPVSRYINYVYL